jgi:hypothetical protein
VKAVVDTERLRMSEVVASTGAQTELAAAKAAERSTAPERLERHLRGDLDTIVAKALKKNPQERYASVAAMADDLHKYLVHEPITARPDTLRYRAAKFAAEGRYPDAEKFERETRDIQQRVLGPKSPDTALSTYNLGCLAARQGHGEQALLLLREAVDHGLNPNTDQNMEKDSDLTSLRGDPRFAALVAYAKEKAAVAENPQ